MVIGLCPNTVAHIGQNPANSGIFQQLLSLVGLLRDRRPSAPHLALPARDIDKLRQNRVM